MDGSYNMYEQAGIFVVCFLSHVRFFSVKNELEKVVMAMCACLYPLFFQETNF